MSRSGYQGPTSGFPPPAPPVGGSSVRVGAKSQPLPEATSLRDQFAMAALTGLLAGRPAHHTMNKSDWAVASYAHADAMTEARK